LPLNSGKIGDPPTVSMNAGDFARRENKNEFHGLLDRNIAICKSRRALANIDTNASAAGPDAVDVSHQTIKCPARNHQPVGFLPRSLRRGGGPSYIQQ